MPDSGIFEDIRRWGPCAVCGHAGRCHDWSGRSQWVDVPGGSTATVLACRDCPDGTCKDPDLAQGILAGSLWIVYARALDGKVTLAAEGLDKAAALAKAMQVRADPFNGGAETRPATGKGEPVHYKARGAGLAWCGHDYRRGTDPAGRLWWSPTTVERAEVTCPACLSELEGF
jgi:hypothetical protein